MATPALEDLSSQDPEGGISLVRTGDESNQLRLRMERPARIGRFLFGVLGAITAAAGLAVWITNSSLVGLALGVFGVVLIVLAVVQHNLLRRDSQHWPDQAILREGGVELFLHNGEVRGAAWSDSDIAFHLIERRAPSPANREYLLVWLMDSKIPPVELSAEGFDGLNRATVEWNLTVKESRRGSRPDATRLIEITQGFAVVAQDGSQTTVTRNQKDST